ncbi:hypothetical protein MLD38_022241 [Melastoma candidum]|uniref:Uncharacterized protein n=1 Tax=Melastoma candidum TaxID=119954 RepID=A0ACB9QJU6_9MYRT|nr:hypothetical protein MLD38_022241 [Melastoma candidum]
MEVTLDEKDAGDWVYRGEGAANIVLSYAGSSPRFLGKVLRIQKALKDKVHSLDGSSSFSEHERLLWKGYEELVLAPTKEIAARLYVQGVMKPLLGAEHVDAGVQVNASKEFLEKTEKNVNSSRPSWRIRASEVDTLSTSVLLISDHSLFPQGNPKGDICISVEIKPKCGFLPSSRYIAKRNTIKKSVTRFKMHQLWKFHHDEIEDVSEYDPLDLFSGSKERISKALKALVGNPQNNLRVFLNGSLVLGGLGGIAGTTTSSTGAAVEDLLKFIIRADEHLHTQSFIELLSATISKSGVLSRLLEVQELDNYDIEGVVHAYYNIISKPCPVCSELDRVESSKKWLELHSLSIEESLGIVRNFLIAATVKDCSLIFCFRRRRDGESDSSGDSVVVPSTNQVFAYKVFFIDLDLKPLEKRMAMVGRYIATLSEDRNLGLTRQQKIIVSAELRCSKCMMKVMKSVAGLEGITSIALDPSKSTVTVIGEADPVKIIKKMRKCRKSAYIMSIGPPKDEKKDDKKDPIPQTPKTCQKCDVWYVTSEDPNYCSIM